MSLISSIRNILHEQINGYRDLLDVLQKERNCLIEFNASGVETLSKEKDTVILRLNLLEEERIRLMNKFKNENSINGDLNLQKLSELTHDDTFQKLRSQLMSLLQSIAELNEFNRILIERSLYFIKNTAQFLDSFGLNAVSINKSASVSREA